MSDMVMHALTAVGLLALVMMCIVSMCVICVAAFGGAHDDKEDADEND